MHPFVFLSLLVSMPLWAQPAEPQLERIHDHLYLFQSGNGWFLSSVVLEDEDGLILVDTQFEDENNLQLVREMKRLFPDKGVKKIIISHAHLDHFIGVRFFHDAFGACDVIAPAGLEQHLEDNIQAFWPIYHKVPKVHDLKQADVVRPNQWVDEDFSLTFLGGEAQFRIVGPNESWRSLYLVMPKAKVAFAGDLYWGFIAVSPEIGATVVGWSNQLRNLLNEDVDRFIPGHGTGVHARSKVESFAQSLEALIDESRGAINGGISRNEFLALEFESTTPIFGDRETTLESIFDELKSDTESGHP